MNFRFALAWFFNFSLFLVTCVVALVYGVTFEEPAFKLLLMAWVAGLLFTWIIIEPSEVLGIVLFQDQLEGGCIMKLREKCKEMGIYG